MTPCPAEEALRSFLLGTISTAEQESLAAHLDSCASCIERLGRLDGPHDPLVGALRGVDGTPMPAEPAVRALLDHDVASGTHGLTVEVGGRIGPYLLMAKLGQGGMGAVYKARHERLGKVFALKVLPPGRRDSARTTRFEREMRAVGRLEHPHIVRATDAGEDRGVAYLAMELISGIDLSRLVKRRGPLRPADACEVTRQSALALAHAHERGLIHRDVKPSNLLLTTDGKVMLLDLGLALAAGDPVERIGIASGEAPTEVSHLTLTETGMAIGTRDYMAPEQATDPHSVDARADIYGLGATLHFLLTGRTPREPSPIPAGLQVILDRMLAPNPADRYQTTAEVAAALARRSRGHALAAIITGHSPRRRGRVLLSTGLLAAAAVLVGIGVVRYWPFRPSEDTAGAQPAPHPEQPAQTAMPVPAPVPEVVTTPKPKPAPEPGRAPLNPNEAQQLQKDWAEHLGQSVEQRGPAGVKMVLIPPGSFEMVPRYHVTITRPYMLGTTEVTRRQFKAFVAAMDYVSTSEAAALFKPLGASTTPKSEKGNWREPGFQTSDDAPITHVSCLDAEAFVAWLSKTDGKTYRLPTEAEWRWACRSGATTQYPFGDDVRQLTNYARYKYNSPPHPCPVGDLRPNAWGLYDMLGNVREWCADGHAAYPEGNFTDPVVPVKPNAVRVQCGGTFASESKYAGLHLGWGHLSCDCNTRCGANGT